MEEISMTINSINEMVSCSEYEVKTIAEDSGDLQMKNETLKNAVGKFNLNDKKLLN